MSELYPEQSPKVDTHFFPEKLQLARWGPLSGFRNSAMDKNEPFMVVERAVFVMMCLWCSYLYSS